MEDSSRGYHKVKQVQHALIYNYYGEGQESGQCNYKCYMEDEVNLMVNFQRNDPFSNTYMSVWINDPIFK